MMAGLPGGGDGRDVIYERNLQHWTYGEQCITPWDLVVKCAMLEIEYRIGGQSHTMDLSNACRSIRKIKSYNIGDTG